MLGAVLKNGDAELKWSAAALACLANRLETAGDFPDARAVSRIIQPFQHGEKRLAPVAELVEDALGVTKPRNRELACAGLYRRIELISLDRRVADA